MKKKTKFSEEQLNTMDEMFGELSSKMGDQLIESIQSYKSKIVNKIDVLSQMGVELVHTESLYKLFDDNEDVDKEQRFGF